MAAKEITDIKAFNSRAGKSVQKGRRGLFGIIRSASKVLPVIVMGWVLAGCEHYRLSRVERLMENDIEAADSLISAMNKPTGKRGRA
ncbi:MAG TPA: hypothetical protein PKI13_07210, partial [Bacteroidaceae bacterium]|nr:hypothetical protein [Bacteroidaceae bacterium]